MFNPMYSSLGIALACLPALLLVKHLPGGNKQSSYPGIEFTIPVNGKAYIVTIRPK